MSDDDVAIIDPIEYPQTLTLEQYKAAEQATNLIEPVERNQTPRRYGSLYGSSISTKPKEAAWSACRIDVEDAFREINYALYVVGFYAFGRTKADKSRARQIARALRRVEHLVRAFNKPDLPLLRFPFDELRKWKQAFSTIGDTASGEIIQLNALKKRLAVAEAYRLLQKYGYSNRVMAVKGGKFCKLAALLYGQPKADLINQCKAHIRAPGATAAEYAERTLIEGTTASEKSGAK